MKFNKLFKRSILGDYDRDGVMNAFDCQPKNKRKQDSDEEKENERQPIFESEQVKVDIIKKLRALARGEL